MFFQKKIKKVGFEKLIIYFVGDGINKNKGCLNGSFLCDSEEKRYKN